MTVGYFTCGRDDFGFGLSLILREVREQFPQARIVRVTPRTAWLCDWLVFSVFWWEHIYVVADFLRRAGMAKHQARRPRIVIGGFNTVNPVPFLAYADYVCVGDGENVLPALMRGEEPPPCVLVEGRRSVCFGYAPQLRPHVHETNDVARIEVARGCRFVCTFCAVTFFKPYRELPLEGVAEALRMTKKRRVALFAPEPTIHSQDDEITHLAHRMGKIRVDSDVRLDRVVRRDDSVPRVGVEGLSERLRRMVRKPFSNDMIVEQVHQAIQQGRRGMFWYMILDLPGEEESDWQEFEELLRRIGELPGAERFVLKPSPNMFLPTPFTPMQYEAIHWDRDYRARWERLFGRGDDREWKVIMAERTRVFSPGMRLLSMISMRAGEEFCALESGLHAERAIAVRVQDGFERPVVLSLPALLRVLERYGGPDRYCGRMRPEDAPWRIVQPVQAHPRMSHLFQIEAWSPSAPARGDLVQLPA